MKRHTSISALKILGMLALVSIMLTVPSPILAQGTTPIAGIAYYADSGECTEYANSDFALRMTGDLVGCHYAFVESAVCTPSGVYNETGTERFVGQYNGEEGTFETTYRFTAKYEDCANLVGEIFGRCQHPFEVNSGQGVFEDVSGRFDIKDDINAGNFPYRGFLRW